MTRPLRIEFEGAFYHVIQRGIERKNIFATDLDKKRFLRYLDTAHSSYDAVFHSYVLMDNHYHLILETPRANLSKIMHYVNTSYAAYYNSKYKRIGPLYQGRFKSILVQQDEYLNYLSCYVHLNPVRAGIVKLPEQYPYSSYSFFTGGNAKKTPKWLTAAYILSMFHNKPKAAQELYKCFVMANLGKEKEFIDSNMKNGWILGDDDFVETIKAMSEEKPLDPEIPLLKTLRRPVEPSLDEIKSVVERRVENDARLRRSLSMYLCRKYTQKTIKEIATFYNNTHYASVSQAWKRIEKRRGENREMGEMLLELESEIEKVSSVKT
jgi:putative transposase